jgi:hypothetical protein
MKDNLVLTGVVLALLAFSAIGVLGESSQVDKTMDNFSSRICAADMNNNLLWTESLYNWALEYFELANINQDIKGAKAFQAVPESNTIVGFGTALFINGLGAAGAGYYLRRKYNGDNIRRYARSQQYRLPIFIDTTLSLLVLLAVSPVLLFVSTSAFKAGSPKVYVQKCRKKEDSRCDEN